MPTIAIDIIQPPCQIAFMGADNHEAGRLAGAEMGKYAKATWDCDYTAYVSLESVAAGAANTDRMGGFRDGFKESCPIPADKERIIDGADRTDPGLEKVTNLLGALPGNRIVVVAINEDGILGAIGAANTLGRQNDLYYAGQGADPSAWKDIACNPNYIATVAYFPERYGTLLIPNMVKALQGETIPEEIFTEHIVVNKDNIRDHLSGNAGLLMTPVIDRGRRMTFALKAQGIRKSFGGVEVLHGVDLDAVGGSVLALLGENGAGKSTLVKIIAGDYTPDGGEVVVDDVDLHVADPDRSTRPRGRHHLPGVPGRPDPDGRREHLARAGSRTGSGSSTGGPSTRRARKILDELGVEIDPERRVSTLRVGERQIIEIARALSRSARLLILDEPTAALSHHEAETLFGFIRRLRNQGVAVIYITHRLDEVTTIADRVQVLRDGNVALLADVATTDRAAMIEAMVGRQHLRDPAPADA